MSTKDKLLLQNEDSINRQLFFVVKRMEKLAEERAKSPTDQHRQLELDRIQSYLEEKQRSLRRIKEQTARL